MRISFWKQLLDRYLRVSTVIVLLNFLLPCVKFCILYFEVSVWYWRHSEWLSVLAYVTGFQDTGACLGNGMHAEKPGNWRFINIGALPHRWICWDRISASDSPPASAKLKKHTCNVTPRRSREFDFSNVATIPLKLFATLILFIKICTQLVGCYYYYFYY